jgi:hypothetical protein
MWYCPACETWVGRKLDECLDGHTRPLVPVWSAHVDVDDARRVTVGDRLRAKVRGLRR